MVALLNEPFMRGCGGEEEFVAVAQTHKPGAVTRVSRTAPKNSSVSAGSSTNSDVSASTETRSCTVDRRITRSKKALREALIALMEEKGFDAITVNDLCSAADLNRGTFYNHFNDKEHLLATFEDEVMADLARAQQAMENLSVKDVLSTCMLKRPLPFLVELFDYLRQQGAFLHAVLGPGGDAAFGPRLRDSVCTHLIQSVLHEKYRNSGDAFVEYYTAFYASAYLGVITHWIETGMKESSEEMALIAMRLLFIKPGEPIRM